MKETVIQVSCFSRNYTESRRMAEAAVAALQPEATVANRNSVQEAVLKRLMDSPAIQAFFPGLTLQDQITWVARRQGKPLPAIVLVTISGDDPSAHLDMEPEAGTNVEFWYSGATEPRDLGAQEATEFIHHCVVDMTMRYARAA